MNANYEAMAAKYGHDEAMERLTEIRDIGGYGNVPVDTIGGFDVLGALDEGNTAISDADKARIAELSGVSRKDVDKRIADGRKALDRGDKSKNHIIPPDQLGEGKINGKTVADAVK